MVGACCGHVVRWISGDPVDSFNKSGGLVAPCHDRALPRVQTDTRAGELIPEERRVEHDRKRSRWVEHTAAESTIFHP